MGGTIAAAGPNDRGSLGFATHPRTHIVDECRRDIRTEFIRLDGHHESRFTAARIQIIQRFIPRAQAPLYVHTPPPIQTLFCDLPPLVWNDQAEVWEEPADGWGELWFCTVGSEVGAGWTDSGECREERQLKARAQGEWRRVPIAPPLTRLLRRHLQEIGARPEGRVFWGVRGGEFPSITYRRAWTQARTASLTQAELASPLGKRPYDLRHACVSTWLNGGVPAVSR